MLNSNCSNIGYYLNLVQWNLVSEETIEALLDRLANRISKMDLEGPAKFELNTLDCFGGAMNSRDNHRK
jgi:hypothetical protein